MHEMSQEGLKLPEMKEGFRKQNDGGVSRKQWSQPGRVLVAKVGPI